MEKESLYIFKLDTQGSKVKFPNADTPAKLGEYTYTAQRMAGTPTLTATLNYPICLDDEWSGEEFVEFRGERYYVDQVPTSSKDNKSIMYKHELQFVSERIVLENVYFMDVVTAGEDTYHSNSTSVKFMGDINEFVGRLNASMAKSGIGYSVVIDEDITSESKLVSLDNVYLAEALQSINTIYELPYYFVGKVCHIGYAENVVSTPFEYRKGLIAIKKTNANYKIVNRVTGVGSSENIPFYYPNDDEKGTIERCQNLMPSIYRESGGAERFYNALNDTYKIPGTNDFYSFKNQYSSNNVKEFKVDFSDIKPTIEGVTNASGQLFGEIADVAFDANDSDELGAGEGSNVFNGTDEYVHSYFYIKLHIYNGDYGFNLFEQGLEGGTAVINMTTGNCAACEFEIGVTYKDNEPGRAFNPVLVDSFGRLPAGDFEQKVTSQTSEYVESQQDTSTNEVWIAVKKDNTTFGVVMPNATNNYKPSIGDKFVITGIKMPKSLVLAAEKRLDEALIKYMSENNDEKFTFTMNFSRVFLAENSYLWDVLNENARVYIRYNNHEYLMYVNAFTCKADSNCLYDISVELTDKLSANVSTLRSTITEIAGDIIGNKLGNTNNYNDLFAKFARKFIRKDQPDETSFIVDFLKGLRSESILSSYIRSMNFSSGALGEGFVIKVDSKTGKSYIEVDELFVRIKAMFSELEIKKLSYAGGNYMFTAAGMKCGKVEEHEDFWRCYLLVDDGETAIENPFNEGDQVRFQDFNIKPGVYENVSNRYYWRLCVGVGEDYIDLSKTDCDANSDTPQEGDSLVQLGNRTDKKRQNAITLSVYGDDAPSIHQYAGIDSYSMAGKEVTVISPQGNKFMGDFILKTGINIMTQFKILEDLIYSEISKVLDEIQAEDNYLYNSAFASNTNGWEAKNDIHFFTVNGKFLLVNGKFYSRKDAMAAIIRDGDRNVLRILSSGIKQSNTDLANKPTYEEGEEPRKFFISFKYKVITAGTITIGFPGQNLHFTEQLEPGEEYTIKEYTGTWDGTGDFELKFTGDIYIHSLALTDNAYEDMITKFETQLSQTNEKIEAVAERTSNLESKSAGWLTTADGVKIWAAAEFNDKGGDGNTKVSSLFNVSADKISLKSQYIQLEGVITANGNIKIHEDGSIECHNGSFTGDITATNGYIGAFKITQYGLENITSNPTARLRIGQDGGRFFEVNTTTNTMCGIRGDEMTALSLSAYGNNSVGVDIIAQAGFNTYAIKALGNVMLDARSGESVRINRLDAAGVSIGVKRLGVSTIGVPSSYTLTDADDFVTYSNATPSYDPVLYLPSSANPGKIVFVKNQLSRNIIVRGNLMNANDRGTKSETALNGVSSIYIFDGSYWVHFFCG